MKKNIYIIFIVFSTMFVIQSCELKTEVFEEINTSIFPKNAEHAKALVTANAYGPFRNYGYAGMYNAADGVLLQTELMSDYGQCRGEGWNTIVYGQWLTTTEWPLNKLWIFANDISSMTLSIGEIEKIDMDSDLKERLIAELHCARGWLAFSMYDLYGPIIIGDIETLKDPMANKILPRLSEEGMREYIVSELESAIAVLPHNYKKGDLDYGRFTKGLAYTVLMKFYMQTKQWSEAEAVGRELMKPEYGYDLVPDYKDIFTFANEKNKEVIWCANSLLGYQSNKWLPHVLTPDYPVSIEGMQKWGMWLITWDFVNTFEPKDKRLSGIVTEYTGTGGIVHSEANDKQNNGFLKKGAIPLKYEIDKTSTGEDSQIDWIVYRYADVVTLLSEAIVRKNNTITQEAIDLLNEVRSRAGLDIYTTGSFVNVDDFLSKLLMERGHELYYEGVRRQDLIRHDKWVSAVTKKAQDFGAITLVNKNYERLPIPQSVIDQGKGIVIQNPY